MERRKRIRRVHALTSANKVITFSALDLGRISDSGVSDLTGLENHTAAGQKAFGACTNERSKLGEWGVI